MEEREINLIKEAQGGNQMAFQQLINIHGDKVMGAAYKFTKNHQDAEDLYQETFLKVYKNIQSFRYESEFFTWVYRILANMAYNSFRKNKKYQTVEIGEESNLWETIPASNSSNADKYFFNNALKDQINNSLLDLSPKQRTVFIMKHFEGKKIKDISAILDCTEGTIKRYLFRATQKLRTSLSNA